MPNQTAPPITAVYREFGICARHAARKPGQWQPLAHAEHDAVDLLHTVRLVTHLTARAGAMAAGSRIARARPFLGDQGRVSRFEQLHIHGLDDRLAGNHETE